MTIRDWLDRNMGAGTPERVCREPFEKLIKGPVGLQSDIDEETWGALSQTLENMSDTGCGAHHTAMVLATYLIALNANRRAGIAMAT